MHPSIFTLQRPCLQRPCLQRPCMASAMPVGIAPAAMAPAGVTAKAAVLAAGVCVTGVSHRGANGAAGWRAVYAGMRGLARCRRPLSFSPTIHLSRGRPSPRFTPAPTPTEMPRVNT